MRVSGPFSFATSSFFGAYPPSELQPFFYPWTGSRRCGVRLDEQGGYRTSSPYTWLLQPSLCDSQGHWWLTPGDQPLAPQRICGCLSLSYGDHTVRSAVSTVGRLDDVPGSPGRLPSGSGESSFSLASKVLRAGVGLPVSCPLLWFVDGPSSFHPHHGPGLRYHASSRVPDSPVLRRLAGLASTFPEIVQARNFLLWLCDQLRIRVNLPKSSFRTLSRLALTLCQSGDNC